MNWIRRYIRTPQRRRIAAAIALTGGFRAGLITISATLLLICVPAAEASSNPAASDPASCVECHYCATPNRAFPCLRPCPASFTTEGSRALALESSPEVAVLDTLSDLYGPVVFDHARHAEMSAFGAGCAMCHHYAPPERIPPCQACHVPQDVEHDLRQPGLRGAYHRQCLGCHRDWNNANACTACHEPLRSATGVPPVTDATEIPDRSHPRIEAITSYIYLAPEAENSVVTFHHEDHVQLFGKRCVDCHQSDSCASCHDLAKEWQPREDPHSDCISCHETQMAEDCTFCHRQEVAPRFDHALRTAFDLAPYHNAMNCASCHGDTGDFPGLDADCCSCHEPEWSPQNFDHFVTGRPLDDTHREIECIGCHSQGVGNPTTCLACHETATGPVTSVPESENE